MSKKANTKKASKKAAKATKPRIRVVNADAVVVENATPAAPDAAPKLREDGTYSGLDAAAKVLAEAAEPLNAKQIVERMLGQNLWKTDGKTPEATIHAAICREIIRKGEASRFRKVSRGKFSVAS
jgi:hypothetical protein